MAQEKPTAHSPLFIIGVLVLLLSLVWIGSNLSPLYEWESFRISSGKKAKGVILFDTTSNYFNKYYSRYSEIEYEFYTEEKEYFVSQSIGNLYTKKRRDTVIVEYVPSNPDLSRIEGTKHRLATRPGGMDIFVFFISIGLILFDKIRGRKKE